MRESRIQTEAHRQFPIPRADARGFDTLSARVVALVDRLLQTAWKTERARMAFERKQAKRHVLTLDDELDELLMSWYDLVAISSIIIGNWTMVYFKFIKPMDELE